jgi:hypothetical protein
MRPPAARPWTEAPWSCSGRIRARIDVNLSPFVGYMRFDQRIQAELGKVGLQGIGENRRQSICICVPVGDPFQAGESSYSITRS